MHPLPPVKTRAARKHFKPIGQQTLKMLSQAATKSGAMDPMLAVRWDEIVGEDLSPLCRPLRFFRHGRGTAIEIATTSSAVAVKLDFQQKQLIARINAMVGRRKISKMVFRHSLAGPLHNHTREGRRAWRTQPQRLLDVRVQPAEQQHASTLDEALAKLRSNVEKV